MIREYSLTEAKESDKFFQFMKGFENTTDMVKVDVEYSRAKYIQLMSAGVARVLVSEGENGLQGALGFLISNDLHNGDKMAVETFWFVLPEFKGEGKKLFETFEEIAGGVGCKKLAMIHLVDSYPESLKDFYTRSGYKLLESHYVKEI
jgi:GNAT superfamily N-acetyltransferase